MRIVKYIVFLIGLLLIWTAMINIGINSGFLLKPISTKKTPKSFIEGTKNKLEKEFVGNLAMAVIENGEVSEKYFYSVDEPIDAQTMFQMASVSKWITAWGIFAMVEKGELNIDSSVDNYLSRWQLPKSEFNNEEVTIRNLLCHTSGLIDGLGYGGFASKDSVQTVEESLTRAADAYHTEGVTIVGYKPNNKYKYSGGGYTILQLVLEEVSGKSFNDYMTEVVFEPLGMKNTSFHWSDTSSLQLSTFYNSDSSIAPHYHYTALAAASLYTNIEDLTLFLKANISSNTVLKKETIEMMNQVHASSGQRKHGLGPMIFGKKGNRDLIIGHDGISRAAINNSARINTKTGDGIIILETGSWSFASEIADEWSFWKTRILNSTVMSSNITMIISILILGYITILVSFIPYMRKKVKITKG